jgi:hypothetical protein
VIAFQLLLERAQHLTLMLFILKMVSSRLR